MLPVALTTQEGPANRWHVQQSVDASHIPLGTPVTKQCLF